MTAIAHRLPDITRSGVDIVAARQWTVRNPGEQKRTADTLIDRAKRVQPKGLVSVSCFASTSRASNVGILGGTRTDQGPGRVGGLQVLSYEQWLSEQSYRDAPQSRPPRLVAGDTCASGQRPEAVEHRLYRSYNSPVPQGESGALQVAIVVVTIRFNGPDRERLQQWIDGVLEAIQAEPAPIRGLVSAHFHASTDGTQVLNYAVWTSEQAYDTTLGTGPPGIGQTDLPQWRSARAFPGVTGNAVTRYALHRSITLE